MTTLHGVHGVVTGGGKGIGAAIGESLVKAGAAVTLMGRNEKALIDTARNLQAQGGSVGWIVVDVTDEASVENGMQAARKNLGDIEILINNAGAAESAPLSKMDIGLWERMLSVNLTGVFLCTKYAVPSMLKKGRGRIVNISSTAGVSGYQYVSAYCAAKHGVVGFTKALARELLDSNITVNAICPGFTDTDLFRNSVAKVAAKTGRPVSEVQSEFLRGVPGERLITPEQVASTVVWLCESTQDAITGQAIIISAGEGA